MTDRNSPIGKYGNRRRHVVIDVETTGLSPGYGHRIIEIGALALDASGRIDDEFHSLIDPGIPIPGRAMQIHGITNEMLRGQPPPEAVFPKFCAFIHKSILVAHNAAFDISFLRHEFGRLGLGFRHSRICTLKMSRTFYPHLENHRLETVYRHLFGPPDAQMQAHRALSDARMAAEIWLAMEGPCHSY